ncbi:NAD(P)H-binding protein [Psychromonas sp. MME1]
MKILVIGALGTVGRKLVPELLAAGHQVAISSRYASKIAPWPDSVCRRFTLNLLYYDSIPPALDGVELIYYLMHAMSDGQTHTSKEVIAARNLAHAAASAGVNRIIYLGSLVSARPKSDHMLARIATGEALSSSGIAVTELRAGIIIAPGSAAFEVMRDMVGHMPFALVPNAIETQAPPIALVNVLHYLVKLADMPETAGMILDAAGPQWLSYRQLMLKIAKKFNKNIKIIAIPGLPIRVACTVLGVVTSVPQNLAKSLIAG